MLLCINVSCRIYKFQAAQFNYVDFITFLYGNTPHYGLMILDLKIQ